MEETNLTKEQQAAMGTALFQLQCAKLSIKELKDELDYLESVFMDAYKLLGEYFPQTYHLTNHNNENPTCKKNPQPKG